MRITLLTAITAVALTGIAPRALPQTLVNPDLSVIGDVRFVGRGDAAAAALQARTAQFEFNELELNVNAYLNPYMRADVTVAFPDLEGSVEVEEANMSVLRGLPLSLQMNVGKYFLDFGKLNTQHPHQWPWMETPLVIRSFLGPEGARVLGARATTLQALGETAITLSASAFMGDAITGGLAESAEHHHGEAEDGPAAAAEVMGAGRVSAFRTVTDATSIEAGVSGLWGRVDPEHSLDLSVYGVDAKAKYRPNSYKSVVWVAEAMVSDREVVSEPEDSTAAPVFSTVTATGVFTALQFQFRKRWDTGGFFDFSEDALTDGVETRAAGAWFAFHPAEETARISIVYRHETSDLYTYTNDSVTLQFLWGMGPHRPHAF